MVEESDKQTSLQYLSFNKLNGYLDPGGNSGFSSGVEGSAGGFGEDALDEFPALPDLTMPFFGGIENSKSEAREKARMGVTVTHARLLWKVTLGVYDCVTEPSLISLTYHHRLPVLSLSHSLFYLPCLMRISTTLSSFR